MSYPKGKYLSKLIAKYFIYKSNEGKLGITNKKLQKLLYYSQGWSLVLYGKPMFKEDLEAWVHGPAVREIYKEYKKYGFFRIKEKISDKEISKISAKDKTLLQDVWRVYGKYDANFLERLSHQEAPWINARNGLEGYAISSNIISLEELNKYFSSLLDKSDENTGTKN